LPWKWGFTEFIDILWIQWGVKENISEELESHSLYFKSTKFNGETVELQFNSTL